MSSTPGKRKRPHAKARRFETREPSTPALIAGSQQSSFSAAQDSDEFLSRKALVTHLEAQRAELLLAMSCVNLARRTIEQHVAKPPFGGESPVTPEQHGLYRQRVLEALTDAVEALRTAYPMLERIAQAIAVEEILKEHTRAIEASTSEGAGTASEAGPREGRQTAR